MSLTAEVRQKNLTLMAKAAVVSETSTGVPGEIVLAQCILESGWLEKAPQNNPFGIKFRPGAFGRQLLDTKEWFTEEELRRFLASDDQRKAVVDLTDGGPHRKGPRTRYLVKDWFATFQTLDDAFRHHAELLKNGVPYREATRQYLSDKNLTAYVKAVGKVYATDPEYATQVLELITQANVSAALAAARRAAHPSDAAGHSVAAGA